MIIAMDVFGTAPGQVAGPSRSAHIHLPDLRGPPAPQQPPPPSPPPLTSVLLLRAGAGWGGAESESCRRIGFLAPRCWWPVPGPSVLLTRPRPLGPGNLFFSPPRHRLCDCRIYYLNSILLNSHLIPWPFQLAKCVH